MWIQVDRNEEGGVKRKGSPKGALDNTPYGSFDLADHHKGFQQTSQEASCCLLDTKIDGGLQVNSSPKIKNFIRNRGPRFVALLGMLGSDADGERANAAALASKMLKDDQLTWGEIAEAFSDSPPAMGAGTERVLRDLIATHMRTISQQRGMIAVRDAEIRELKMALNRAARGPERPAGTGRIKSFNAVLNELVDEIENRMDLSDREEDFLTSIRRRSHLTEKQLAWLKAIAKQAGVDVREMDDE